MTPEVMSKCLLFMRKMKAGTKQEWTDTDREMYELALSPLTDAEGRAAIDYIVLHDEWRPSVARIVEIAAEQAAPIPDANATYDEIAHLAETVGLYGACLPERPSIRVPGPPKFSHPLVGRVVQYCGGWASICSGEANMAEGLKKQVRASWESVAREWRERVRENLKMPPEKRNPALFRAYQPYRLPLGWTPDVPAIEPSVDELPQYDVDKRFGGGLTRFGR